MARRRNPEDNQQPKNNEPAHAKDPNWPHYSESSGIDEFSSEMIDFFRYFNMLSSIPLPKGCVRDTKTSATATHHVVTIEYQIPKRESKRKSKRTKTQPKTRGR